MFRGIVLSMAATASLCAGWLFAQDAVPRQKPGIRAYFSGDFAKARELLTAAIEDGSKDPQVFYFCGRANLEGASTLIAQDAILEQKYGLGVHAYFAGDYAKAFEQLRTAIDSGLKDPRAFYFRGLTYLKLGRPQEAAADFQKGAQLESQDINKFYNVAKSLERVQGAARVELEKYRVEARMVAFEEAERMRKARYEEVRREEERVLREQAVIPAPEQAMGAEGAAPAAGIDPFAAPDEQAAAAAEKKAGAAGKKAAPGAGKKATEPPAPPANEDPFGSPAEKKPEPPKKAEPPKKLPVEKKEPAEKKADNADPFAS